ncbi:anti-sigma factor antagonist [Candidatus Uabimicrobium amorphum]|uniref:Anti-sigma factor antagonist n=1 Tax=Uabimicrobium amorphum TaxID=2596890 RepID=A0A5S9IX68_UABAM|nr:anti-sigma factor antagonist [Candidatus Uabimicrobium amorphum]BBM88165.1 anti-sigma factor antagonist [Candidatus Uabimicrobium amorphum]
MADLTFTVEQLPEMNTAAIVRINGAIDAKTVVHFQEKLDELQNGGYTRFILDMVGIKYVNSTGLGTLVNVADALENRGGGIALVKIHPKVKVVFDMLGLNAFFKIFSNEKEALGFFQKSAKPEEMGGGSSQKSQTQEKPASSSSSSSGSSSKPPASKSADSGYNVIKTKVPPPQSPGSPYSLVCAVCTVKLTIPKPGSYKCPRCGTFFKLTKDGTATFTERKKAASLQMKLACTDECVEGLCEFVGVLASRIGFPADSIKAIKECLMEICGAVIEKAYDNKQYYSYSVVINPSSTELKIQISDYGKFIYDNKSCFDRSRQVMDEFEHKQHPKGGNVITMVKKFN